MGYYSSVRGEVSFTRQPEGIDEAKAAERKALEEQLRALGGNIVFDDEEVPSAFVEALRDESVFSDLTYVFEIDEDGLTASGEGGKVYHLQDEIEEMAKLAQKHRVLVNGIITVTGEEAGDIWRMVLKDSVAERQLTKIVWPDGTEYKA